MFEQLKSRWRVLRIEGRLPSRVLKDLIREVENSDVQDRREVRAKAKIWLLSHGASMGRQDVLLARTHFAYLLPPGWGL